VDSFKKQTPERLIDAARGGTRDERGGEDIPDVLFIVFPLFRKLSRKTIDGDGDE
jgi:hypothetical protein